MRSSRHCDCDKESNENSKKIKQEIAEIKQQSEAFESRMKQANAELDAQYDAELEKIDAKRKELMDWMEDE